MRIMIKTPKKRLKINKIVKSICFHVIPYIHSPVEGFLSGHILDIYIRAYSRNLGQRSLLARKATFLRKKSPKNFTSFSKCFASK